MILAIALLASCYATDGDSLGCGSERIRLASIDAPEIGPCKPRGRICTPGDGQRSKRALQALLNGPAVIQRQGKDRYGRTLARVTVNGRDLSCAMVRGGWAVVRYGKLDCRGVVR